MKKSTTVLKLTETALLAALCYVSFMYLQITIPLPGGDSTALHIGNAFCVLASLLIGGVYGGLAGSLGMTIADLTHPLYYSSAPKTFVLKFFIGLIAGFIAHRVAKINNSTDKKYQTRWACISAITALSFNVIFDPIVGYFYKIYVLGVEASASAILAKLSALSTFANAIVSVILVTILYSVLRPILSKAGLLPDITNNLSIISDCKQPHK